MNLEIRIPHRLDAETAAARLREVAARHDVRLDEAPGGRAGELEKKIPIVGPVRGRYELEAEALFIVVTRAPSFLSPERVREMLEGELGPALTGNPESSGGAE